MVLLLLAFLLAIQQVPTAAPGGTLRITVLERGTGIPVSDTSIWIRRSNEEGRTVRTGPDGSVTVEGLPPGRYIVDVGSDTHLRIGPAAPSAITLAAEPALDPAVDIDIPGEARLDVIAGGSHRVVFRLERGGVISGHVVADNRPVAGATVELVTRTDRKVLGRPLTSTLRRVVSNADGSFRFDGLNANTYLVRAHPAAAGTVGWSNVYYPGTLDVREATPIVVASGTVAEMAFNLARIPAVRLSGRVIDEGAGGRREIVVRRLDEDTGDAISHGILPLKPDGAWVWESAGSGVHALFYTRKAPFGGGVLAAAWRVIYVGEQSLNDIDLPALQPALMSGSFEFSGGPVPSEFDPSPSIFLRPEGVEESIRWGLADQGSLGEGNAFRMTGIFGASTIDVTEPDGWIAEAVVLKDGRDILDRNFTFEPGKHYEGVRVVLSNRVATVRGSVARGMDRTRGGLMVIAFPEEEALRKRQSHLKTSNVEDDGTFVISNLRPGVTYLVSACDWTCSAAYEDGGLDELAATATRIFIDRPGIFTVTLKTTSKIQLPTTKRDVEGR